MEIAFINHVPRTARIPRAVIAHIVHRAQKLFRSKMAGRQISVAFVSPKTMRQLNATYRSKPRATNVLSFASQVSAELGDIVICPAVARHEATAYGLGFNEHVAYLFAHGLLHLIGFDHKTSRQSQRMERAGAKLLSAVNP